MEGVNIHRIKEKGGYSLRMGYVYGVWSFRFG